MLRLSAFWIILFLHVPVLLGATPYALPDLKLAPDAKMNALFEQHEGWVGADGDYSVPLGSNRTLWLFSDTWIGKIQNGKRVDATIVNNSAAIQEGRGSDTSVKFFVRRSADSKPCALITPDDGHGWFWLQSGVRTGNRLYLYLAQIEKTDEKSVFGFRQIGQWLAVVTNPDDEPLAWRIQQHKLPCTMFSPARQVCFGAATVSSSDELYVFGTDEIRESGKLARNLIVAKVGVDRAGDFSGWRFYQDGQWGQDFRNCAQLADGLASEFSVSYVAKLSCYVLIYTENGLSANILARTAVKPEGPWSEAVNIYTCPESAWDKRIFCYAAKAHPELCGDDELLVTYAANSTDFWQTAADARLYWPRFVRAKIRDDPSRQR